MTDAKHVAKGSTKVLLARRLGLTVGCVLVVAYMYNSIAFGTQVSTQFVSAITQYQPVVIQEFVYILPMVALVFATILPMAFVAMSLVGKTNLQKLLVAL